MTEELKKHKLLKAAYMIPFILGLIIITVFEMFSYSNIHYSLYYLIGGEVLYSFILYFMVTFKNRKQGKEALPEHLKDFYTFTSLTNNDYPFKERNKHTITFKDSMTYCYKRKKNAPMHYPSFLMIPLKDKNHDDYERNLEKPMRYYYFWNFNNYKPLKNIKNPADFFRETQESPFEYTNENLFKEHFLNNFITKNHFKIPYFRFSIISNLLLIACVFSFNLNTGILYISLATLIVGIGIFVAVEKNKLALFILKILQHFLFPKSERMKKFPITLNDLYTLVDTPSTLDMENFNSRGIKVQQVEMIKKRITEETNVYPIHPVINFDFWDNRYHYEPRRLLTSSIDQHKLKNLGVLTDNFDDLFFKQLSYHDNEQHLKEFIIEHNLNFLDLSEDEKALLKLNFNLLEN